MKGSGEDARMLTAAQVAQRLGTSRALVYRLVERGQLPGHRFGSAVRVRSDDLERYLERTRTGAG